MDRERTTFERVAVIVNPASGKPEPVLAQLNQVFGEARANWRVYVTSGPEDVSKMVDSAVDWGASVVGVYGGDGTVSLVSEALAGGDVPLAILPGGTANVMASELEIPNDLPGAAGIIVGRHERRRIDLGRYGDKSFMLRLGIGYEADMVRGADRKLKEKVGSLAYFISALRAMQEPQQAEYEISVDGQSFQESAITCLIANSMNLGLPETSLSPRIRIDDGLLDLIMIRKVDLGILSDLAETLRGDGSADSTIGHWQGQEIEVSATPQRVMEADGELAGRTPVRVQVNPGALEVLVPAQPEIDGDGDSGEGADESG